MDEYFEISCTTFSDDYRNLRACINRGIDSRLEGFTRLQTKQEDGRFYFFFHHSELQTLIRRLLELESESAEMLADDIVYFHYGYETV